MANAISAIRHAFSITQDQPAVARADCQMCHPTESALPTAVRSAQAFVTNLPNALVRAVDNAMQWQPRWPDVEVPKLPTPHLAPLALMQYATDPRPLKAQLNDKVQAAASMWAAAKELPDELSRLKSRVAYLEPEALAGMAGDRFGQGLLFAATSRLGGAMAGMQKVALNNGSVTRELPLSFKEGPGTRNNAGLSTHPPPVLQTKGIDIWVAHNDQGMLGAAEELLIRQYGTKSYNTDGIRLRSEKNVVTLVATDSESRRSVVGTMSIRDGSGNNKLNADRTFPEEMNDLRRAGAELVEFGRFAIEKPSSGKLNLAIFHDLMWAATAVAKLNGMNSRVVIEINPKHAAFYRTLNFNPIGKEKTHQGVGAPAQLFVMDPSWVNMADLNQVPRGFRAAAEEGYGVLLPRLVDQLGLASSYKPTQSTRQRH